MTTNVAPRPYENTSMAQFLRKQIDTLGSLGINQREIALAAGYDKPNFLSMLKRGDTKVPLEKVEVLARALRVDPSFLMRLACQQPNSAISVETLDRMFKNQVPDNEFAIVQAAREGAGGQSLELTQSELGEVKDFIADVLHRRKRTGVSPLAKSL